MKKNLTYIIIFLVSCGIAWMWFAPRIRVDLAARDNDPTKMDMSRQTHQSKKVLANGIEVGLIHLNDGSDVKYWFINKHVQPGSGTTRFESADGESIYLHGCFCCEVMVPEFENWNELQAYVQRWDGSPSS